MPDPRQVNIVPKPVNLSNDFCSICFIWRAKTTKVSASPPPLPKSKPPSDSNFKSQAAFASDNNQNKEVIAEEVSHGLFLGSSCVPRFYTLRFGSSRTSS